LPPPIFKKDVLKFEDLQPGMELKGTVLNVVDFGVFVDIGLKESGLVHISQMADRFIKNPYDVTAVGKRHHRLGAESRTRGGGAGVADDDSARQ
jgi:uncharacterized protein